MQSNLQKLESSGGKYTPLDVEEASQGFPQRGVWGKRVNRNHMRVLGYAQGQASELSRTKKQNYYGQIKTLVRDGGTLEQLQGLIDEVEADVTFRALDVYQGIRPPVGEWEPPEYSAEQAADETPSLRAEFTRAALLIRARG
jgi:hypothetical protein